MREIIKDHLLFKKQLIGLAYVSLKKEYSDSSLGWFWALIKPGFMIFVYWFTMRVGLRSSVRNGFDEIDFFGWLLVGLVAWFFINDSIRSSMNSMRSYRYLVTKMKFPINVIPTFTILSNFIVHLVLLSLALLYVIIKDRDVITLQWLQIPWYLAMMLLFLWAWGQITAPLAAISGDFHSMMKSILQSLFWFSGVIFDVNNIHSRTLRWLLKVNPVTYLVQGYRGALFFDEWLTDRPMQTITFLCELLVLMILAIIVGKNTRKELADVL